MGSDSRALIDGIDSGMATMASAMAKTFEAVAAFDEQGLWEAGGASSMTSWLAARYRLAKGTAREWVRVAHALRDLPAIAEAFAQGRLSWDQLRPLTRFADPTRMRTCAAGLRGCHRRTCGSKPDGTNV
jgi:Domain of unknown function (DUF222)